MALNVLKSVVSALTMSSISLNGAELQLQFQYCAEFHRKLITRQNQASVSFSQAMHINFHKVCVYFTIRKIWNETSYLLPKSVKTTFWGKEFISYVEPLFIILLICF